MDIMPSFRVPEGPYDIDAIMSEIRAQIIDSTDPTDDPELPHPDTQHPGNASETAPKSRSDTSHLVSDGTPLSHFHSQLELMRRHPHQEPEYQTGSHRKILGLFTGMLKKFIQWGCRPYIMVIHSRQNAFNDANYVALHEIACQLKSLRDEQSATTRKLNELADQATKMISTVTGLHDLKIRKHDTQFRVHKEHVTKIHRNIEAIRGRLHTAEFFDSIPHAERMKMFDLTRGTRDDLKKRQEKYVELFIDAPGPILDIGCGRGEMLDMLRCQEIESWGVDLEDRMVEETRSKGIHAVQADGLEALDSVEDASLGGIFSAQVIEHMYPGEIMAFLNLSRRKIAEGGRFVLETLNPSSIAVLTKSYFRDLDHKQPLHPEYMKLIIKMAGFIDVQLHYTSPFTPEEQVPPLPSAVKIKISQEAHSAIQDKFNLINDMLYGMQDYYVTARQPTPRQAAAPPEPNGKPVSLTNASSEPSPAYMDDGEDIYLMPSDHGHEPGVQGPNNPDTVIQDDFIMDPGESKMDAPDVRNQT